MKAADFLAEFDERQFPQPLGPSVHVCDHDPRWSASQLKRMAAQGIIQFGETEETYHLTLKATKIAGLLFDGKERE